MIKDGALSVTGEGRLQGKNVGFYLIGDQATIKFSPKTEIELSAPVDGLMAGILFFEDRNAPVGRTHMIRSNNAREMVGTVYLSRGVLIVDTTKRVADQSAYTAIIARRLKLFSGPHLTLNTDYDDTDVPVPFDINVGARHVVLSE